MTIAELAPRRPRAEDTSALIGLLAVLEGEVWVASQAESDELPEWAQHLAARLAQDGLLEPEAGRQELRRTLGDLNQRLRYVLGEHNDPDARS